MKINEQLLEDLREQINITNIYAEDEKCLRKYNLTCAVLDRLDTAVQYLNNHDNYPAAEEDFMVYIMFCTMVLDGVKLLLQELDKKEEIIIEDKYEYFKNVFINSQLYTNDDTIPTDEKFFEYIRAMIFAHPYETNRQKFLNKATHYSPWVICNRFTKNFHDITDGVGVRIYVSDKANVIDLIFSFRILSEYVNSRYKYLQLAVDYYKNEYKLLQEKWAKHKVNLKQKPKCILNEMVEILNERRIDVYSIERLLMYISVDFTEINDDIVKKYRDVVINCIPEIAKCIDNQDYDRMEQTIDKVEISPKKTYQGFGYHMEKISNYLNESGGQGCNYLWGLQQADSYSKEFAKKWVEIDTNYMSGNEIRLLVTVANYFEAIAQREGESHD